MRTLLEDIDAYIDGTPTAKRRISVFLFNPGAHLIFSFRISKFLHRRRALRPLSKIIWYLNTIIFSCYISPKSIIGRAPIFPHPVGIVIGEGAKIGDNVTVYQHVTLGRQSSNADGYPTIGSGVTIYTGAIIVGKTYIGDNCIVGANALILHSMEAGSAALSPISTIRQIK